MMKPLRVLLVAPVSERRNELVMLLQAADHQLEIVPDVASAAESIREPRFDALVIDLHAPNINLGLVRQAISPDHSIEPETLDSAERRHLAQVLRHTEGNKRKAAHLLGISRSTLLNKVRKYGLEER
jgi:DNA-binding NtrC family response regulator